MEAYKLDDLTILDDAVALIRHSPAMYLAAQNRGPTLAGRMVHDIALHGALPVCVAQVGAWWLVSADADWLRSDEGTVSTRPFFEIVPCPQWGQYAFRTEVLLTAFAEAIVVAADARLTWIAGDETEELPAALRSRMEAPGSGRHVAFRMSPDSGSATR